MTRDEYHKYLGSEQWTDLRRAALVVAGNACQVCNYDAELQVHHRTYENVGNEKLSDLTVLCDRCHKFFHFVCEGSSFDRPFITDGRTSVFSRAMVKRKLSSDGELFNISRMLYDMLEKCRDDFPNEDNPTHEIHIEFCVQDKRII